MKFNKIQQRRGKFEILFLTIAKLVKKLWKIKLWTQKNMFVQIKGLK